MEEKIYACLEQGVGMGVFPGAVVGVIASSHRAVIPFGTLDGQSNVTNETIYDVASITKSIPTSSLALLLYDNKLLSFDDPIKKFLPNFRHDTVTVRHLLTQTLVIGYDNVPLRLSILKDKSAEEILSLIYHAELLEKPGAAFAYTNAASILLGKVIEKIASTTLDACADEQFFKPLHMTRSSFHTEALPKGDIAPSEIEEWRGEVKGSVHDESAHILRLGGHVVGSAGLFSTVPDFLTFLSMLLNSGCYEGKQYLSEQSIQEISSNQILHLGLSAGLGWELNQPQYMGKYAHPRMFGKTGFTGCVVIGDPVKKRAMVLLSNYTYPKRKENARQINEVRRVVADIVFAE